MGTVYHPPFLWMGTVYHPPGYRFITHRANLQSLTAQGFAAFSTARNARARFFNFINSLTLRDLERLWTS
jgi:hypothetical protein